MQPCGRGKLRKTQANDYIRAHIYIRAHARAPAHALNLKLLLHSTFR